MDNNEVYALFEDIKGNLKEHQQQVGEYSKSKQQPVRRTSSGYGLDTREGVVQQFCKGTSGTDQSHADQVRGAR